MSPKIPGDSTKANGTHRVTRSKNPRSLPVDSLARLVRFSRPSAAAVVLHSKRIASTLLRYRQLLSALPFLLASIYSNNNN